MPSLLHDLLNEAAAASPDHKAIVAGKRSVSYADLAERAGRVAAWLLEKGAQPGSRIGLLAHKDIECYVAVYGILMAGCAYVPLDRRSPANRLGFILNDCGIATIITTKRAIQPLTDAPESLQTVANILVLDGEPDSAALDTCTFSGPDTLCELATTAAAGTVDTDLAYVLYTSGSTGKPKGVMISHAVSMSFVRWAAKHTSLNKTDRVSGHAPLHFDLSIFDIYSTAKVGATLYPVPDGMSTFPSNLSKWIIEQRISVWYSVPSILSMMAKQSSFDSLQFPDLRTLLFAGEVFPVKYLKEWLRKCPDSTFMNWYGPTETNVITSYTVTLPPEQIDTPCPIGKRTDNAALYCRNDSGQNALSGELIARGPCVALGYWGDNKKTKEKFVPNDDTPWLQERLYMTGDLVELDKNGDYVYLGRIDHQIKCRGYRIELGEIETALYKDNNVQEAAVIPVPDDVIGNQLIAFVALNHEATEVPDSVVDTAGGVLPPYMMPHAYIVLPTLPKTSNGKTNRQLLLTQAQQTPQRVIE